VPRRGAIDNLLTPGPVAFTSRSRGDRQHGRMADVLAVLSFVVFVAAFMGLIWCMERV